MAFNFQKGAPPDDTGNPFAKKGAPPKKKHKGKPNPALQRAAFARLQAKKKGGKKKPPPQFQKGVNPFAK